MTTSPTRAAALCALLATTFLAAPGFNQSTTGRGNVSPPAESTRSHRKSQPVWLVLPNT